MRNAKKEGEKGRKSISKAFKKTVYMFRRAERAPAGWRTAAQGHKQLGMEKEAKGKKRPSSNHSAESRKGRGEVVTGDCHV